MLPQNTNFLHKVIAFWGGLAYRKLILLAVVVIIGGITGVTVLVVHRINDVKTPSKPAAVADKPAESESADGSKSNQTPAAKDQPAAPSQPTAGSGTNSSGSAADGGQSSSSGTSSSSGGSSGPSCLSGTHVAGSSDAAGGCWPGPNNTGVPAGTVLSTYTGPCTITAAGTVIDAKTINCDLSIQAANVTIKNSKVNGLVTLDTDLAGSSAWSMTVQDTEVDAGVQQRAAISTGNMTVIRANLHGGITSAQCEETSVFCTIQDSWLHGQQIPDTAPWHLGGFLSDGGGNMTLKHNTVVCDHAVNSVGEGCTGDLNFIPNFAAISGALVQHNLLGSNIGSSYCTYGGEKPSSPTPHSDHIVYKDNIFQRGSNNNCAAYGPVTNFDINQPGNEWTNNTWADGGVVDPAN